MTNSNIQEFGCQNCGHPYKAYPPDNRYRFAYMNPCKDAGKDPEPNHNYEQGYECEDCHHKNVLYWCNGFHLAVVSKSFDMELDEKT